ncbi:vascular endothelial growth factor receptor 1 isoform X1 [Patella vulgata]|uniref:vascular endothelial growth factor receptor 1 isoform X1 n=2 Tax=Patella vulgata TaxID=6465 RepID=UPI00217F272A|nr:vascular endothelial growth factor receptor 1 isoform X1 [Patella vulgata]
MLTTVLCVLTCAFIYQVGLTLGFDVLKKPQIDTLNSTLYLNKGDNLTLTCSGNNDVKWYSTALGAGQQGTPEPEGHGILFISLPVQEGGRYAVQLNITNAQYYDTGRYSCLYIDDYNKINSSVYIYVRDPDRLLLGHASAPFPFFLLINRNRPAVIPCKVSDPTVNVSLVKSIGMVPVSGRKDVTYDPEVGFTLYFPNLFYAGNFKCIAEYNGTEDEMMVVLRYSDVLIYMPPVVIDVEPARNVMVNSSVKLTCKVKVERDTMIQMTWDYPNKPHTDGIRPSKAKRETVLGQYSYSEISMTLDIDVIQVSHMGVYRCTIKNYKKESYGETIISVYEKTFVYLTPGDDVEVVVGDKKAFLRFGINAFPEPSLEWYFEDKKITANHFYGIGQVDDAAALSVFYPTASKMGKYTLFAYTQDMNTSASMNLFVFGPPKMKWATKKPVTKYMIKQRWRLECQATGYPAANVTWLFKECLPQNCSEWVNITETNLSYEIKGTTLSSLDIIAERSGWIRCQGENNYGMDFLETEFTVVEVPNGLGFSELNRNVTEFDRLELECYGSRHFYKDLVILKVKDSPIALDSNVIDNDNDSDTTVSYTVDNNFTTSATDTAGFTTIVEQTTHSNVRKALFEKLSKKDAGVYECKGLTFDKKFHTAQYTLKLHDIIPPFMIKSTSGRIRAQKSTSLSMECLFGGFPEPQVQWYKDGDIIRGNNTMDIGFSQNGGRMIIDNATEVHIGTYMCEAWNYGGKVFSSNMTLLVGENLHEAGFSKVYIGIIVCILIAAAIIVVIVICFIRRMRKKLTIKMKDYEQYLLAPKGDYNPEIPIDEQTASLPYDPKWEFPKDRLRMGNVLGQGAFGRVIKTEAIGITEGQYVTTVAVKMVKDCTDKEQMMALLSELKILIHIGQHLNILNLLGAVTKNIRFGELYVIVEYCHFGNVRSYLLKNKDSFVDTMEDYVDPAVEKKREAASEKSKRHYINTPAPNNSADLIGPPLTTKNLICWSFQAARGMEYLASKKYIHRDLAARNVLLSEDNVIKISDFGLAKDCYKNMEYKKKGDGPVPVKWMALESLTHKLYTTKSDVWSYGVLMYELFSLGGNPYSGIELNEKFIGLLKSGYRMEKPSQASDEIYQIMLRCWDASPDKRPSFVQLVNIMGDFLEANVKQYYLDLNSTFSKMLDESGADEEAEKDGYLKMSGSTDYTPMSVAMPDSYTGEDDVESARYINQARWRKEKADDIELQPLTGGKTTENELKEAKPIKDKDDSNSPVQLRTRADIHCPDDTDSGHSSSYAPGTSPVDNNGYLVPKLLEEPEKKTNSAGDRSFSSSAFHNSLFNDSPPPDYRAVMEENPNALPV